MASTYCVLCRCPVTPGQPPGAPPEKVQLVLSVKLGLFVWLFVKSIKNIYQSQRNVRIKCISLRCIAKQEIERQVNHVWKLFNVWQNHNMKFQTRTHIHTHTHALRGAHTTRTYIHAQTHIYTHTHTLFKKWWHQGTWSLSTFSISSNDLNKDELNTSEHNCRRRHADRLEPLGLRKDAWKAQEVFVVSQETVTVVICCNVVEHCKFYELVAVITRQLS